MTIIVNVPGVGHLPPPQMVIPSMRPGLALLALAWVVPTMAAAQRMVSRTDVVDVLLIGVHAVDERVAWVSGQRGTWARTTDGGATWVSGRVPGADSLEFRDLHATSAETAWLLSIGNGANSRIYHTTDGGRRWTVQLLASDPRLFLDCFGFWDARRAIVTSDTYESGFRLFRTDDGGERWLPVTPERLPPAEEGEGMYAASGTCLVTHGSAHAWITTTGRRVLRTADGGDRWSAAPLPLASAAATIAMRDTLHGVAIGSSIEGEVSPGDNVVVTEDGGTSWSLVGRVPAPVYGVAIQPGTRTLVATGPKGGFVSSDGGRSWRPLSPENHWSVTFTPGGTGWMVGAKGRITRVELGDAAR